MPESMTLLSLASFILINALPLGLVKKFFSDVAGQPMCPFTFCPSSALPLAGWGGGGVFDKMVVDNESRLCCEGRYCQPQRGWLPLHLEPGLWGEKGKGLWQRQRRREPTKRRNPGRPSEEDSPGPGGAAMGKGMIHTIFWTLGVFVIDPLQLACLIQLSLGTRG